MALLCLLAFDASALRKVDAGSDPRLKPDEGLLVVSVDSSTDIAGVAFRRVGSTFSSGSLLGIGAGRALQLYAVPAGEYRWSVVTLRNNGYMRTEIRMPDDDPEWRFEVKAGQVAYAGDLIVRQHREYRASVRISNRALPVIDWLAATHPATKAAYPFLYSGNYPDPFPDFYAPIRAAATDVMANLDAGRTPPTTAVMPLPPALLWTPPRVQSAALNGQGTLVAEVVRDSGISWAVDLVDVDAGTRQRIATSATSIGDVQWKGDRTLLVTTDERDGERLRAFVIGEVSGHARGVTAFDGPFGGSVVSLLREDPTAILYEASDSAGNLVVHRLGVQNAAAFAGFRGKPSNTRLNKSVDDDLGWYADGHGRLRLALARRDGQVAMFYGSGESFREILRGKPGGGFDPERLSHEGDLIYGLTDDDRAQRDLVEFDPLQVKVTRTLFSKPGVDVASGLFNARNEPIGATYYEGGRLVSEYFDERDGTVAARLSRAFPGQAVEVLDRSDDGQRLLLSVDGSAMPPRLYFLDVAKGRAQLIDDVLAGVEGRPFVATTLLPVRRPDGQAMEAFVTMPPGKGSRPLVVLAHGGPFGTADRLHFDPEVQFLASLGYAVLQVNFRGSDGYGKAFREGARNQYGIGIEDDIDAALQAALKAHTIDESRMCMLGTSYGGYSALMSAIRWPARFRCVVSVSGVSDRALFFTASDSGRSALGRAQLERWMGDPRRDAARMVATSPLYQYERLSVPLMLVHGREDQRVDFEHTRRLVRMLNLAHRQPVVMAFADEGHGFTNPKVSEAAWTGIAGFLQQYLGVAAAVDASPAPAAKAAAAP